MSRLTISLSASLQTAQDIKQGLEKAGLLSIAKAVHLHVPLVVYIDAPTEQIIKQLKDLSINWQPITARFTGNWSHSGNCITATLTTSSTNYITQLTESLCTLHNSIQQRYDGDPIAVVYEGKDAESVLPTITSYASSSSSVLNKGAFDLSFDGLEVFIKYDADLNGYRVPVGKLLSNSRWFFRTSLFIGGRWCRSENNSTLRVINPATRQVFHYVQAAGPSDVEKAVAAAKKARDSWSATPAAERANYLNAIADYIEQNKEDLARLETLDNGKALREAELDMSDAAACFRYYANLIVDFEKNQLVTVDIGDPAMHGQVLYEPVGVCGLIIPWNYPLLMAAWKVAPCLAAGCTAVLKPSELTPMTALELAAAACYAKLPPGVLNIINGDGPSAGAPMTTHPDIDKLAFTGSVATGSKVMEAAARSIKRVTLELGGKSPAIVCKDADIDQAIDWIMVGIFFNQGQVCSATSRLLVHEDIKDELLRRLKAETEKLVLGDGLKDTTQVGPIVNDVQYHKVLKYIESGKREGATVLVGGQPAPNQNELGGGYFIQPTIFTNVTPNMTIWKEEIFGPVLAVASFKTEEEAIQLANDSKYGLAAAVFTRDKATADRIARKLRVGIVWMNCSQPTLVQLPWGGMKQSGLGRELGPWGLMNYVEVKQLLAWVDPVNKGWGWFQKSKL